MGTIKVRVICNVAKAARRQSSEVTISLLEKKIEKVQESLPVAPILQQSSRLRIKNDKNAPPLPATPRQSISIPQHNTDSKSKRATEIMNRLDAMKHLKEQDATDRVMKSKVAKAVETIHIAQRKEVSHHELNNNIQQKTKVLMDLDQKNSDSHAVLEEYKQQVRGQKELVRYYDKKRNCLVMMVL